MPHKSAYLVHFYPTNVLRPTAKQILQISATWLVGRSEHMQMPDKGRDMV